VRADAAKSLSARNSTQKSAELAYRRVVEEARQSVYLTDYRAPDTLDGRFELICLHAFLYLHRLGAEQPQANRLCQSSFGRMFADFDRTLREMGTGDLSLEKHVERMARAFYGCILAREEGLAGNDGVLAATVSRNIFGPVAAFAPTTGAMAAYICAAVKVLRSQAASALIAGHILFEASPSLSTGAGSQLSEVSR
jgi:cytochrome b pre-mRNA-processing protein 3